MRTEIDLKTYKKRNQYFHFSKFPDPSYGLDVDIDVTNILKYKEEKRISFFPIFLYLLTKAINSVYELHLREVKGHIYYYDQIHPTWTVMGESGVYSNVGCLFNEDFLTFYKEVVELNDKAKKLNPDDQLDLSPLCNEPNVIFASCLPLLSVLSFRHPTPSGDHDNLSVPRILWDKYKKHDDGTYHLTLNVTVSHTLVDGFPLANVFLKMQELANNLEGLPND